jgi:SAM-dependent methyltransferase
MGNSSLEGSADANQRGVDVNLRSGPQMREYERIADRIAAQRVAPVLDWGCGWGQVTDLLAKRGVVVESFVGLPFPDDHFAAVLSCGVLEHVQYPEASLDELHRILKPGGRLLIYKLPNRFSYLEALARGLGLYYHGKLPNDRVYDRGRVSDLLVKHGFRVDEFRRANMLPLTIAGPFGWRYRDGIWRLNRLLGKIPIVNFLATNLEVDATATGKDGASRSRSAHL